MTLDTVRAVFSRHLLCFSPPAAIDTTRLVLKAFVVYSLMLLAKPAEFPTEWTLLIATPHSIKSLVEGTLVVVSINVN